MKVLIKFILLILVVLYIIQKSNQVIKYSNYVNPYKICILLTTCVNALYSSPNKKDNREYTYNEVINKYLNNTDLDIYVVESSEYNFPQFQGNQRVHIFTYKQNLKLSKMFIPIYPSPSPLEANSIIKAIDYFKLESRYNYIIKITGRYFIPNIKQIITKIPENIDLIVQNNNKIMYRHCEVFGCKVEYLKKIMNFIINNSYFVNFEIAVSLYMLKYKYYVLPKIYLEECIVKGSSLKIMCSL